MHHWFAVSLFALLLLVLPPAVLDAAAQCSTGCSSSSSCNGTGKSGCLAQCDGSGECTCRDDECLTQLIPAAGLTPSADVQFAGWAGATGVSAASLVVDCRGNVQDVLVHNARDEAVLMPLERIEVRRPAPVRRPALAIRE
jgi:hypothetical protein